MSKSTRLNTRLAGGKITDRAQCLRSLGTDFSGRMPCTCHFKFSLSYPFSVYAVFVGFMKDRSSVVSMGR